MKSGPSFASKEDSDLSDSHSDKSSEASCLPETSPSLEIAYVLSSLKHCNQTLDIETSKKPSSPSKFTSPKLTSRKLTSPKLTSPKLTSPKLTPPKLTTPKLTSQPNIGFLPTDVADTPKAPRGHHRNDWHQRSSLSRRERPLPAKTLCQRVRSHSLPPSLPAPCPNSVRINPFPSFCVSRVDSSPLPLINTSSFSKALLSKAPKPSQKSSKASVRKTPNTPAQKPVPPKASTLPPKASTTKKPATKRTLTRKTPTAKSSTQKKLVAKPSTRSLQRQKETLAAKASAKPSTRSRSLQRQKETLAAKASTAVKTTKDPVSVKASTRKMKSSNQKSSTPKSAALTVKTSKSETLKPKPKSKPKSSTLKRKTLTPKPSSRKSSVGKERSKSGCKPPKSANAVVPPAIVSPIRVSPRKKKLFQPFNIADDGSQAYVGKSKSTPTTEKRKRDQSLPARSRKEIESNKTYQRVVMLSRSIPFKSHSQKAKKRRKSEKSSNSSVDVAYAREEWKAEHQDFGSRDRRKSSNTSSDDNNPLVTETEVFAHLSECRTLNEPISATDIKKRFHLKLSTAKSFVSRFQNNPEMFCSPWNEEGTADDSSLEFFEVGEVIGRRIHRITQSPQYYVCWKGYGRKHDQWLNVRELYGCLSLIRAFEKRLATEVVIASENEPDIANANAKETEKTKGKSNSTKRKSESATKKKKKSRKISPESSPSSSSFFVSLPYYPKDPTDEKQFPLKLSHLIPDIDHLSLSSRLRHDLGSRMRGISLQRIRALTNLYGEQIMDSLVCDLHLESLLDLLQFGFFHTKSSLSPSQTMRLKKCAGEIIDMIRCQFRFQTQTDLYEEDISEVNLREVWLRGETFDFVLDHWKSEYPILTELFRNQAELFPVIGALQRSFGRKLCLESVGVFLARPNISGQNPHCDGSSREVKSSSKKGRTVNGNRLPESLTITIPLDQIVAVNSREESDDGLHHNGATEFYPGSHLSSARGPFEKCAILASPGDAIGWGFDLIHCGGENSSNRSRLVAYFVYHLEGKAKHDYNLCAFRALEQTGSLFSGTYRHKSKMRGMPG